MIRRNTAAQVITLPFLGLTADGSAVTSSASITVLKDGTSAAGGGTLAHVSGGVWKYTLTQGETDAAIVGLILTATNAIPVVLNLVTTGADTSAVALGALRPAVPGRTIAVSETTGKVTAEAVELDSASVSAIRDGIPKVGETHRYTQVDSGATTTDVSIGEVP